MEFVIYLNVFFVGFNSFIAGYCFSKNRNGMAAFNLFAAAVNAAVVMVKLS